MALFERIELASADHGLPDASKFFIGDRYYHPELRLSVSHHDSDMELPKEADSLAEFCIRENLLASTLGKRAPFKADPYLQRLFVSRLVQQVRLAIKLKALIVGNRFFYSVYRIVGPYIKQFIDDTPGRLPDGLILELNEETLTLTGLEFAPASFDAFVAIRASKEISSYAASFREAIAVARSTNDLQSSLLNLMKTAMDSQEIAKRATGAIQTGGSILNVVGLIPIAGTVASIGSIGADLAGRAAEAKARKYDWYLLGSEMRSLGLKEFLAKLPKTQ